MIRSGFPLLLAVLVVGCATVPRAVTVPQAGVRVISFAMESGVPIGNLNAAVESPPGFLSGGDAFRAPLLATVIELWKAFPAQATEALGGRWDGPGAEADHPNWVASSSEPISSFSVDWSRARGYFWPDGFRFVDSTSGPLPTVALDYPEQLLLAVECRMFVEDVGGNTESAYPEFRMGLLATFTIYGTMGEVVSRDEVLGYSQDKGRRRGATVDRAQYADLAVQAQADVLKKWAQKVRFLY